MQKTYGFDLELPELHHNLEPKLQSLCNAFAILESRGYTMNQNLSFKITFIINSFVLFFIKIMETRSYSPGL